MTYNSNLCISGVTIQKNPLRSFLTEHLSRATFSYNFFLNRYLELWHYSSLAIIYKELKTWSSKKWCQSTIMMLTQLSQLLHINVCIHYRRGRYLPYLDPPYINPSFDLCVWGLGGKGGGFVDSEVELSILPKSRSVSAFNLGGPALNRRRDGESNDTTLDLVLIPASS